MEKLYELIELQDGNLTQAQTAQLFQDLIDGGMNVQTGGAFGETAAHLIETAACHTTH